MMRIEIRFTTIMPNRISGLFITGTDTGVGKTYVAALIVRTLAAEGRTVGVYKPVASGCRRQDGALVSDDAVALWEGADRPGDLEHVCPQRFEAPLAPPMAARAEGREVDIDLLHRGLEFWREQSEIILVEGVGGLMSPIAEKTYVADLAAAFGFPLVVVSRNVLGTINHTLQTLITASAYGRLEKGTGTVCVQHPSGKRSQSPFPAAAAYHKGLPVAGVVLNNPLPPPADDASLPLNRRELASHCVPPILAEVAHGGQDFDAPVDWFGLAR